MVFQRILITGANGLLGQHLVARMSRIPEYDVLATGRHPTPRFSGGSCGYVRLDITDAQQVRQLFLDFAPSVVVNCAAMTEVDRCERDRDKAWRVNVEGVENLAQACKSHGTRFIQLSTDFVFDGIAGPYRENDRPNPVNFYGRTKLASENAVRQLGLQRWSIVRTILLYGTAPYLNRPNFVLWVVDRLSQGRSIQVVTDQFRSPTYVVDLAAGIERIVRYNKTGMFHLSGREYLSVYDFGREVARAFDLDPDLVQPTDGSRFKQTATRPPKTGFIILKAETELGYRPRTMSNALADLRKTLAQTVTQGRLL